MLLRVHIDNKGVLLRLWQQDYNRSQQHEFTWKTESTAKEYTENTKTSEKPEKFCDKRLSS